MRKGPASQREWGSIGTRYMTNRCQWVGEELIQTAQEPFGGHLVW